MLAIAGPWLASPVHAGPGWGASTDASGNRIDVPTYYANSPAGLRPDPRQPGAWIDTGRPLRKFVDALAPLGCASTNNLGQCIPVAVPDKTAYPGSDYYEIAVVEYAEQMHSDLREADGTTPHLTKLRGYVQLETPANAAGSRHWPLKYPDGRPIVDAAGHQIYAVDKPHYLGPVISAIRGLPVRIKYTNLLPQGVFDSVTGTRNGDLFLPVDTTLMGAGAGPDGVHSYSQNRAEIHLHGGDNPWISDGTPHQWITPAGESTTIYTQGASFQNVPDMDDPGRGSGTLYFPNNQSARLMFYHDHTAGITRLNVYAGEAAGYLLSDEQDAALIAAGILPDLGIPLVIQDKTFVPRDVRIVDPATGRPTGGQDAKWDLTHWGRPGDLWWPHVYEPNQDPDSVDGTNPVGRWDLGPLFWPIFPAEKPLPTGEYGNVTTVPEAFHDTPVVNGTAYPTLSVEPKAYRFRILNGANDRFLNLGLYRADGSVSYITVGQGGTGYSAPRVVLSSPPPGGRQATATATTDPATGAVTAITVVDAGEGYREAPTVTIVDAGGAGIGADATAVVGTELKMIPAAAAPGLPGNWPTDGRDGGVPDPAAVGPDFIQIGNEGGFLPAPAVIPPTPINYEYNRRSVTVLNVSTHGLYLGPAERADVIVDFSRFAGQALILYNDAPAPVPAFDPRIDYYTGNPDLSEVGGAPSTQPGFGPNTRTIMQIKVAAGTPAPAFDASPKGPLATALPAAYKISQPKPVVPQLAYNVPFPGLTSADTWARIYTGSLREPTLNFTTPEEITYTTVAATTTLTGPLSYQPAGQETSLTLAAGATVTVGAGTRVTAAAGKPVKMPVRNKAIQELFEPTYGRMNATLGVELPFTSALTQTTIPLAYVDPATETVADGETQIWKITHNGVDTHPVHFHLVNVQLINRVGWDGTIKPPTPSEVGWKETVKMNPLEDIVVAVRAKRPLAPFGLPQSRRLLDPTQPAGSAMGFTQVDPATGNPATVLNSLFNFDWEYVWHCHILGHEENDMMRPVVFNVKTRLPALPIVAYARPSGRVVLNWTDGTPIGSLSTPGNPANEIGFRIERANVSNNGRPGPYTLVGTALANATSFTDLTATAGATYSYRVFAFNASGSTAPNPVTVGPAGVTAPAAPGALGASLTSGPQIRLNWTDNARSETGFIVERASADGSFVPVANVGARVDIGSVSYVDTAIAAATTYRYRVKAINGGGESAYSNIAQAVVPSIPSPPAGLTASAAVTNPQNATVLLNWSDTSGNESGFTIQRATDTGFTVNLSSTTLPANTTTTQQSGLARGRVFYFRVQAFNAAGASEWTTTSVTTP